MKKCLQCYVCSPFQGHPFMESLFENKPLLYSLTAAASTILLLTSGTFEDLCQQFEIVPMPDKVIFKSYYVHFLSDNRNKRGLSPEQGGPSAC